MKKSAALFLALLATPVFAASQGGVGSTSSGQSIINSSVNAKMRISDLNDIDLGRWDGVNALSGADDVCVWATTRSYKLIAKGNGSGEAFVLRGSKQNGTLGYTATWSYDSKSYPATLVSGQELKGQATNARSNTCSASGDLKARLTISISAAEMQKNGVIDNYSGVLSLTVAPI